MILTQKWLRLRCQSAYQRLIPIGCRTVTILLVTVSLPRLVRPSSFKMICIKYFFYRGGWTRMDCNTKLNYICYLRSYPSNKIYTVRLSLRLYSMVQLLSECGPPPTVNMTTCVNENPFFPYLCPVGQVLPLIGQLGSFHFLEDLVVIPKAKKPCSCVSKCHKDSDCYGMTWLSEKCYHRRLNCQPKNDTIVIPNVTFHPDDNSADFGMIKTCNRYPSGLQWTLFSVEGWYPSAFLQSQRKACGDIDNYPDFLVVGEYLLARDSTTS